MLDAWTVGKVKFFKFKCKFAFVLKMSFILIHEKNVHISSKVISKEEKILLFYLVNKETKFDFIKDIRGKKGGPKRAIFMSRSKKVSILIAHRPRMGGEPL